MLNRFGGGDECKCIVRLLDDTEVIECQVQAKCKAQYLLDYVCQQLDVVEKDYFGLRYVDQHKQRKWFDFTKSVASQVPSGKDLVFCFRVKFYPPDPMRLQEATRYQLYLQLKRDLQHGRLYSPGPGHDLAFLAALCLQEELGDFDPERHLPGYVSEMNLVLNQTEKLEAQVEEFHSGRIGNLVGVEPPQAVNAFLRKAATFDTYGIDPHPVKDPRGARLYIGTNHSGVATFHNGRRTHHFRWIDISKLNYEGRMFIIHIVIMEDARTKKKHTVGFKCASSSACRTLWRYSVEQRIFFTFRSSADIPAVVTGGSFFSRGSKVRYCGRVERELSGDFDAGEPVTIPSTAQQQQKQQSSRQLMSSSTVGLSSIAAVAAAAAARNGGATGGGPALSGARAQREAFASRRSASEPVRNYADQDDDCCDDEEEEEEEEDDEDSLVYESMAAVRGKRLLGAPAARRHHHQHHEDGSTASASTKTSSVIPEGHDDSYEASSCGSDDRSDVASWVALDLRGLRGHHHHHHPAGGGGGGQHQTSRRSNHHQQQQRNGYDTTTIDSDFYGYAPSQTGSAADSWTLRSQHHDWRDHHSVGSNSRGSRHSVSPARYPGARYRDEGDDSWTDSNQRSLKRTHLASSSSTGAGGAIPLPAPPVQTANNCNASRSSISGSIGTRLRHHWLVSKLRSSAKRFLLVGTSLFTMFSLAALTLVLVYETDFHWAIHLRHWPEMVFVQRHLYIPLRNLFLTL